jgi:ribonuclease-3
LQQDRLFFCKMSRVLEKVQKCESIIDYQFVKKRHCVDALFAYSGYCHELGEVALIKKNDGLGILGDIILQLHLCKKWLELGLSRGNVHTSLTCKFVPANQCAPEQWNQVRQEAASNKSLASVGRDQGLDACVVLNPGTTNVPDSVMATTVEAIIGAVSLDGGNDAVGRLIDKLNLNHDLLKAVMSNISFPSLP